MSTGNIAIIIREVERRRTAFAVARLIMLTGMNLRGFELFTEDDPAVLDRLRKVLPRVLDATELGEVEAMIR